MLFKKMQYLQEENHRLRDTLKNQQSESERQQNSLKELENKMALLKIAGTSGGDGGKSAEFRKELRQTVTQYIREIDHCIASLNE